MTHTTSTLYRILDANLDRAREGLRVVEEWCRLGLENAQLSAQCKQLRQELASWHHPMLRRARDTAHDPGTHLTHPQEATRTDVPTVVQANLCRVQEALRVLEEYSKIYDTQMAAACKQMRYQVYILDTQLQPHHRLQQLLDAPLYLVTSPSEQLVSVVEAALQGGLKLVQYREKQANDDQRLAIAQQLCQLCHQYQALFIVNDRIDIAVAVDADGVHLGQQDMTMAVARQMLGLGKLVGRSTTNPQEMERAIQEQADYIGVGPIYETPTKVGKAAVGHDYIRYANQHAPMPYYAIGGIDETNLGEVLAAGAQRVAVVRAIMNAPSPTQRVQQMLQQFPAPPASSESINVESR
ncbi:thiamine phosphate synthase [Acaryochloris sp. IP29b_bin.148]|uniref:thiamine phosphate synthase n=1 Tax=Acaryochloris sp. IP29b_bin.148 TaxID=2969218 RepID=UPI002637578B|nr:thiamine phosphate synthase [Acaryochloris sp. IP29b_bin.148]